MVSKVCGLLHRLIDSSIELQLRIILAEDGHLLKFRRADEPAVSLMKRVLSHRRALETFQPKLTCKVPSEMGWVRTYHVGNS